jgi:hypothetical protein
MTLEEMEELLTETTKAVNISSSRKKELRILERISCCCLARV